MYCFAIFSFYVLILTQYFPVFSNYSAVPSAALEERARGYSLQRTSFWMTLTILHVLLLHCSGHVQFVPCASTCPTGVLQHCAYNKQKDIVFLETLSGLWEPESDGRVKHSCPAGSLIPESGAYNAYVPPTLVLAGRGALMRQYIGAATLSYMVR